MLAGVIAVGIAMCLLVTWIPKWPFAESLAVGVVAIFLGVLCLPGLQAVTKTLTVPSSNGTGLWFVKGTEDQRIAPKIDLYAYTTPLSTSRPHEELDIWNDSSQPIRWALLLVGNAMLIPGTISENQIWRSGEYGPNYSIFVGSPESVVPTPAPGQLFSGTLGPASEAGIYGEPYGESFASSTSDQTIVRLPSYGQGVEGNVSGEISGLIDKSLGGIPVYDGNWTLTVDGSYVPPMESIAQASPALATGTNIPPGLLQWTGQTQIEATYTVVDQGMLGVANNLMFVFAILLGVAGAGVLGSLQGIIHVLLSRDTSGDKTHDAPQPRPKDAT